MEAILLRVLYLLGLATAFVLLFKGFRHLYIYCFHSSTLPKYLHGHEPWALVTGATGDIGTEFASQMSELGFNIILHGRNEAKLRVVENELAHKFPNRKFRSLVIDAATATPVKINKAIEPLKKLNLVIVCNNAGGADAVDIFKPLEQQSAEFVEGIINLNCRFATHLVRLLLPTLYHNSPSLILNISSSAVMGFPFFSAYGGAKSFMDTFTISLDAEAAVQGKDLDVQSIVFSKVNNSNHLKPFEVAWTVPNAKVAVKAAIDRVGCGEPVVTAYWPHRVEQWPMEIPPSALKKSIKVGFMKKMKDSEMKSQ